MIAPTINLDNDSSATNKVPMYLIIKQYLWDFWQYAETMLVDGYTSIIVKCGDFNYSYFLWFQDSIGKQLFCQRSLRDLKFEKPTGILSGTFYK